MRSVSLTRNNKSPKDNGIGFRFPIDIAKALIERNYNRATIEITEQGFLIKPYINEDGDSKVTATDLPNW